MRRIIPNLFFLFLLGTVTSVVAQHNTATIDQFLKAHQSNPQLQESDIAQYLITDHYATRDGKLINYYLKQTYSGIPVDKGRANIHLAATGEIVHSNVRFIANLKQKANLTQPVLTAEEAVKKAAQHLSIQVPNTLTVQEQASTPDQKTTFANRDLALEPITASLTYVEKGDEGLVLSWEVIWYEKDAEHYWNMKIDAKDGTILSQNDMVIHCSFGSPTLASGDDNLGYDSRSFSTCMEHGHHHPNVAGSTVVPNSYNVFAMPVESPSHGDRSIVVDPADDTASPFGWHDTNGEDGAEFTITRGNNVHAYLDINDINQSSGDEPDGGADLEFDFFYDDAANAAEVRDAAVVNLFYWNNIIHDVWYQYGFDEPSGNFQANNYGNGGEGGDHVNAEAQDGGGLNNANFATPPDGGNGRMQMYLWSNPNSGGGTVTLTVDEPGSIAGDYFAEPASFGPSVSSTITEDVVLVDDGSAAPTEGCQALVNGNVVDGKIALIDRGDCTFVEKVGNAEDAGAIAAIMCNNVPGAPITMGGTGAVNIPSVMISQADCDVIKAQLDNGVVVTLEGDASGGPDFLDGDFDNGIIAHEYAHGVSNRLTGGPSAAGCLFGEEQMGEGWSDFWGLIMTIEPDDAGTDIRGIGTFAIAQPTNGGGIRPAPYSTDFAINDYTYGNVPDGNISVPHGVGFVWCTMLWDMTWALIDEYGFDDDFYFGTGGNNIAMKLVLEGMRLQPCDPGFVDGRDAILQADEVFYGGANRCLIWEAFANRGLGFSADQGSSGSRSDGVEAFDLPPFCTPVTAPPTAAFGVDGDVVNCSGYFQFSDNSEQPHFWDWDFGDGTTSSAINPTHTYAEEGTYTVTLIITNPLGADTSTLEVTVDFIDAPTADDVTVCQGNEASLEASGSNGYIWYEGDEIVHIGNPFITPALNNPTTYQVAGIDSDGTSENVGPADNSIGAGGYHNTGFTGTVLFEAHQPVIIRSVWVDAGNAGPRTISLFDENQTILKSVEINVPAGPSTVLLNLEVEQSGTYQLGGTSINLYRNENGAQYPYEINGLVTLTGSSATTAPQDYYYYCYNWEVVPIGCKSPQESVDVAVLPGPTANFSYIDNGNREFDFTDESNNATSWSWNFGDGATSTEQNPTHTYADDGNYQVTLTVGFEDCESTTEQDLEVFLVNQNNVNGLEQLQLRPNIGSGTFDLMIQLDRPQLVEVQLYNILGQTIQFKEIGTVQQVQERFDISDREAGTYLVEIKIGEQSVVKKYVLVK